MIIRIARALMALFLFRMAEAGGGAAIEPAQAREFVQGFVPDPKILDGMDDTAVVAYHGSLTKQLGEHVEKARASHDWRKDIAGDNADALKNLERFASPKAVYDSYSELRGRLSKGELKAVTPFPEKGTDEQKAQWRTENGVPADGKYEVKLPDTVKVTDADKPFLESFTKYAHGKNLSATAVNEAASWFFTERAARAEQQREEFETKKRETAAALGTEWGVEYKPNMNRIQGMLDATLPADQKDLRDQINNAILTNPHFARHYVALALQLNPTGTMTGGESGATEGALVDEIKKIEGTMKTDHAAYIKDEKGQARYRDLLDHYARVTGKTWGQPA